MIFDYSGHKTDFAKISWIFFHKTGKDLSMKNAPGKTPIAGYKQIKAALLKFYGKESDHTREMDGKSLIDYLKQKGLKLDWNNLKARLDDFSYAAVLFKNYRSRGVHRGRIATKWDQTGQPIFGKSHRGE